MTRVQLACCCLLSSAFVLAGLLLARLDSRQSATAVAGQLVQEGAYTFMTARTAEDDEALFVLDNMTERVLIFDTDVGKKRIELMATLDLAAEASGGRQQR